MKTKIRLILLSIFWLIFSACTNAQQNTMKPLEVRKSISIDSVPNIKINKVVYYQKPLEFIFNALTDTSYIPVWYKTFCAEMNMDYFKNYSKEAIHYFSSELRLTESDLKNMQNIVVNAGGFQEYFKKNNPEDKYFYVFGEIWLTSKNNNINYLIIQGFNSKTQIQNLNFSSKIIEKNIKNEEVDSLIYSIGRSSIIFKVINDTLKWIDQNNTADNIILDNKHSLDPDLHTFKDMCYKKPKFFQSEIENGKRMFKTMEKDKDGSHKVKKVSDKPE